MAQGAESRQSIRYNWLFALVIVVATLLVYEPAWFGKPLWDDNAHLTKPELRSLHGLGRIWFEPGATQQYYPLVHSLFWLEQRLWGNAPAGYHFLNILLHAGSALLLWRILQELKIPGAWLAAMIFALHPVQVESVAWISELKNTLSGVFYFGAALMYLKFNRDGRQKFYIASLALFLAGLLCKTVIATLPAALLVVLWWKNGRLSWKRDVLPLIPFFAAGAAMGMLTAWVERKYVIGNEAAAFGFTFTERFLIAGRALWFYLEKIIWPANLTFIYPRWNIGNGVWWLYLFPAGWCLFLGLLWMFRKRSRGPLASALFFTATLFPALGFVNVYPFIYSFVADHFQYLAITGPIVFFSAGMAWSIGKLGRFAAGTISGLLLVALAILTWRQSGMYADAETLHRTTIARNPGCWMAYNDLGNVLLSRGEIDSAAQDYRKALELKPDYAKAENNLGEALFQKGRTVEAAGCFEKALQLRPDLAEAENNLGNVSFQDNRLNDAATHYKQAIKLRPDYPEALNNLGSVFYRQGHFDPAIAQYRRALEIWPDYAEALSNLGGALAASGRLGEAVRCFEKALAIQPNHLRAMNNLAWVFATSPDASLRNGPRAVALAEKAVQASKEKDPMILATLAAACAEAGQFERAKNVVKQATGLATSAGNTRLADLLRKQSALYEHGLPLHEAAR